MVMMMMKIMVIKMMMTRRWRRIRVTANVETSKTCASSNQKVQRSKRGMDEGRKKMDKAT